MALDFPKFYLMGIGFENQSTALLDLQRQIGSIVTNNEESNIFVGKVSKAKRAAMELKSLKIFTEPIEREVKEVEELGPPAKKPRIAPKSMDDKEFVWIDSDTASEDGSDGDVVIVKGSKSQPAGPKTQGSGARSALTHKNKTDGDNIVTVVHLAWLTDSLNAGKVLPLDEYVVYTGTRISKPSSTPKPQPTKLPQTGILSRARDDSPPPATFSQTHKHKRGISYAHGQSQYSQNKRPPLLHESTTEHEEAINLPPLPEYCKKEYCCQRPTPSLTPNDPFIAQLRKILRTRQLISDDIGERAYNKAIAAIAAYPFTITTVEEILRLPGCGPKYAILYQEWRETGHLREVDEEFEHNEKMQVLNLFYGILDVGPKTANLLYEKGYRDLDDIVERGWDTLDKNQQVGVKYYDDFQAKIPREEVERIGDVVLGYANDLHQGFQMVICGGYRRGKKMCGDVDIILTHPEENVTDLFIDDIVYALAEDGWIKYKLQFSHRNSERGQEPVEWKGGMPRSGGGFDTLDKALVVWQDPNWPTREADLEKDPKAKNPNTHRRVDIIVSPWKTAGCAILGWSGANMFERDIRRYCRKELHYKFDSSGVRSLDDGSWVNLEGDETDLLTKEKKVFEGLRLDWIEPTLRCTDG